MKKNLLRLGSVVENGLAGVNPGWLSLIYTYLLQEFNLEIYRYIGINQIGTELDEFVMIEKKKDVHINIRYPNDPNSIPKDKREGSSICLDIIHKALLRLAEQDERMDVNKLEAIRNLIIKKEFSFDLVYKSNINEKNKDLIAKVIIHPTEDSFDYYVQINEREKEKCKLLIYKGKPTDYYIDDLFYYGKWKGLNEFILTGKRKEVEIRVLVDECRVELKNLTSYAKPPFFEMMKSDISTEGKEKAYQDWQHSLPPAIAAVIRDAHN